MRNPNELSARLQSGGTAGATTTALVYAAAERALGATLMLGHGAGAGQRSAFMVDFAHALSALGLDVVTFNFLYTEQRRRIPDRAPALEACYRDVIAAVREAVPSANRGLFIGGKSMGGRIATQVAAADRDLPITGLVLLGYPLHPPGRPDQRRDKHLAAIGASADRPATRTAGDPGGDRQRRSFVQAAPEGSSRSGGGVRQHPEHDRQLDCRTAEDALVGRIHL